jgi:Fe-S cluster biogenesis protein NfuA
MSPEHEPVQEQPEATVRERVVRVLDTLRPYLQSDGGDIELIDVDAGGVVRVRFHGACVGCPAASITMAEGVERTIREKVPEVSKVLLV